jgi:hypothetical protein
MRGKGIVVFHTREALFLGCGDQDAVLDERGGALVDVAGDAQ